MSRWPHGCQIKQNITKSVFTHHGFQSRNIETQFHTVVDIAKIYLFNIGLAYIRAFLNLRIVHIMAENGWILQIIVKLREAQ